MEKNILLIVEYDGTNYFGFQLQAKKGKKEITIQEVIEIALYRLFNKKIRILYASRTDKGVHAKGQVVSFKIDTKIPLKNIKNALNSFLPEDIRIKNIKLADYDFNPRFSAKSKIYRYVILNKKEPDVFYRNYSWHIEKKLSLDLIKKASIKIIGKRDFSIFAKEPKTYKNTIRHIKNIWIKKRGSFIYIDIEADGFLRNMARNIVSFLVRVGKKDIEISKIPLILKKTITYTNKPAPSSGLYLLKVNF